MPQRHTFRFFTLINKMPMSVAERSKATVYGRSLARIAGSSPAGGMDVCDCFLLSGGGLCDGPIPHPEESYLL